MAWPHKGCIRFIKRQKKAFVHNFQRLNHTKKTSKASISIRNQSTRGFSSGCNSQLYCCRLNSILFIDVSLIGAAYGEFSFILINAFDNCVYLLFSTFRTTQFILQNHDLSIRVSHHVWTVNCEHGTMRFLYCQKIYSATNLYLTVHVQNITPVPIFLLVVHAKIGSKKNPIKPIPIAIYLFIVMDFITGNGRTFFCTAWNHSLEKTDTYAVLPIQRNISQQQLFISHCRRPQSEQHAMEKAYLSDGAAI